MSTKAGIEVIYLLGRCTRGANVGRVKFHLCTSYDADSRGFQAITAAEAAAAVTTAVVDMRAAAVTAVMDMKTNKKKTKKRWRMKE